MQSALRGAIAGAVATIPMSAVMLALHNILPRERRSDEPVPPKQITTEIVEGVAPEASESTINAATVISHFGYGAAAGALYSLLADQIDEKDNTPFGALYGCGVWAGSYSGWLPAADILPSAKDLPQQRNIMMIAAHLVWGAALAKTDSALA